MKMMVVSDIHGSAIWCEKIIEKYREVKADRLLILGDILYHGPRNDLPEGYNPKAVIPMLNEIKDEILAVRGNCDTEVDQMVLDFPILADYIYVMSGEKAIFATHGHHYNPQNPPKFIRKDDILLTGHTHVACDVEYPNFRYMNPGSPSIPKENTPPSYIIIEDGNVELKAF